MNFYEDKQSRKLERYKELADKRSWESKAEYEHGNKLVDMIPMGQPILIGHHSEGMHRRHLEKISRSMDKAIELKDKAEYYEAKVKHIENPHAISSDDPEAVTKLKAKLEEMLKERESIKARTHEGWELSNLSGNMLRVKERIKQLEALQTTPELDETVNDITLTVDKIENRVKLFFPGKPAQEIITELKRNGFHWSPFNKAWQRMISNWAITKAQEIQRGLKS